MGGLTQELSSEPRRRRFMGQGMLFARPTAHPRSIKCRRSSRPGQMASGLYSRPARSIWIGPAKRSSAHIKRYTQIKDRWRRRSKPAGPSPIVKIVGRVASSVEENRSKLIDGHAAANIGFWSNAAYSKAMAQAPRLFYYYSRTYITISSDDFSLIWKHYCILEILFR